MRSESVCSGDSSINEEKRLELEVFAGQEKSELSMIEVARAILELRGRDHEMHFSDLVTKFKLPWNIKQRYPRSLAFVLHRVEL